MSSSSQISEKDIVKLLISLVVAENNDVDGKNGIRRNVPHNVFRCPKGDSCIAKGERKGLYRSQKAAGYTNAYRHLLKCFVSSNVEILYEKYREKLAENNSLMPKYMRTFGKKESLVKSREKAVYDYICYIVDTCSPLATVDNKSFRIISNYQCKLSRSTM